MCGDHCSRAAAENDEIVYLVMCISELCFFLISLQGPA
jgi:hypothetical protein